MTQEEKRPREFWLYPFKATGMIFCYKDPQPYKQAAPENFDEVRVIEFSAYEDLKAKLKKAKEALRFYEQTSVGEGYSNLKFPARDALKEIEGGVMNQDIREMFKRVEAGEPIEVVFKGFTHDDYYRHLTAYLLNLNTKDHAITVDLLKRIEVLEETLLKNPGPRK